MKLENISQVDLRKALHNFYEREGEERAGCDAWLSAEAAKNFRIMTRHFDMRSSRMKWSLENYVARLEPLALFCSENESPFVLDAGCGMGSESLCLAHLGARVLGVDLRSDRLLVAAKRLPRHADSHGMKGSVEFVMNNIFDLKPAEPFHAIWANESASHIDPAEELFKKCHEWLAPGGRLFIAEHNASHPYNQFTRLRMRGTHVHSDYLDETTGKRVRYAKERIFTINSLRRALEKSGLRVVDVHISKFIPGFMVNEPGYGIMSSIERKLADIPAAGILGGAYVMVAEK